MIQLADRAFHRSLGGLSHTVGTMESLSPLQQVYQCTCLTAHAYPNCVENISHRICWPFGGDQPVNTVYLTEKLDVAYELLEVRVGLGLKPIFRNGKVPTGTIEAVRKEAAQVLDNAFDKDGERKRVNLEKLREVVLGCWEEGGSSKRALDMLVEVISA